MKLEGKKISLVVPVYNVEQYLEECVKSILHQTYSNVEVILVDDGSKDSSGAIADKLAKEDERIRVIHKENGGVSSARNVGIENATGDYIMFPDSDDFLMEDACEVLLNKIVETDADFVVGNYINCYPDGTLWERPVFNLEKYDSFKLSIKDYKDSFFILNSAAWNKIFNREFINKINARFEEGYAIAEDAIFTTYCFIKSKNVYYIPNIVYAYRQREINTSASVSCGLKYFNSISKSYKKIYENFKENDEIGFYRFFYAKSMTYMLYKFIDSKTLSDEERIEVLSEMRWFYRLSQELDVPACQESLSMILTKIINGDYLGVIEVCKVIADVRSFMPSEIKEKMSKPQADMYQRMMK